MNREEQIIIVANGFEDNRARLIKIAQVKIPDMLKKRLSAEDLFQETYLAVMKRLDHFCAAEDIPVFIRIRTMMIQTLNDLIRKNLACQKRDAMKELDFDADLNNSSADARWSLLASSMTSPRTKIAKVEKAILLREMLKSLSPADQEIIEMRNFENLSNNEVAKILDIDVKAASIRYVRALKRLKDILTNISEFN